MGGTYTQGCGPTLVNLTNCGPTLNECRGHSLRDAAPGLRALGGAKRKILCGRVDLHDVQG